MRNFEKTLAKAEIFLGKLGLNIIYINGSDKFSKGDLDGKNIWINKSLSAEEKLFNLLHLAGHTIQWNINPDLIRIGSKIHKNPSPLLLSELMKYEYDAALFSLSILHNMEYWSYSRWLNKKCKEDMLFLYNFYITGRKTRTISKRIFVYKVMKIAPKLPRFIPRMSLKSRNGIVMAFK